MGDTAREVASAIAATRLSEATRAIWASAPPEPSPGQVWRARWESSALLVLLVEVQRATVLACPITSDVAGSNSSAFVVPETRSSLQTPLVTWVELRRQLPVRVLDRCLGEMQSEVVEAVAANTHDERLPRGRLAVHGTDPSLQEQARLEDRLDELAAAAWAPVGIGGLKDLFDATGVSLAQVRQLPGVPDGDALSVRRGDRPLDAPQIEALVARTGVTADRWWEANPQLPEALIAALDRPAARAKVVALAAEGRRSEIAAWRSVAYDVFSLAARQTGEATEPNWEGRLGQYFAGRGLT